MPTDTQLLDRFHAALVDEIRAHRPELLESPFTVAEIYQELVPYRTHRDRIGVEMNGDYEHLLIRLLAGEGDYLVLEADAARKELRAELESRNPNTGRFREFAAADVRLNPAQLPGEGDAGEAGDNGSDGAVSVESLAPAAAEEGGSAPEPGLFDGGGGGASRARAEGPDASGSVEREREPEPEPAPPGPAEAAPDGPAEAAPEAAPDADEDADAACSWCRGVLPSREKLNYCPFCGTDVHVVPCPSCGEALEPDWRFCIACGAGVASD